MSAVKDFERMFEAYLHSKAARAWRLGAGDRDAALAYLESMAGQDPTLAEAIRQAGLRAALKTPAGDTGSTGTRAEPVADYETIARTGGLYLANHPD